PGNCGPRAGRRGRPPTPPRSSCSCPPWSQTSPARRSPPRKPGRPPAAPTRGPTPPQGKSEFIMTTTADNAAAGGDAATGAQPGRVARVIGPVVDVEFSAENMPDIYNALTVDVTLDDQTKTLTMHVEQHLRDDPLRAISMHP